VTDVIPITVGAADILFHVGEVAEWLKAAPC
jgi:hypothetical protein